MSKGLPYEGIMALDEKAIAENFPNGAREFPKNRWQPADTPEAAVKSLHSLLQDKRMDMGRRKTPGMKFESLMSLTLEEIRAGFCWGAIGIKGRRDQWRPAEVHELPDYYVEDLEKLKKQRIEAARLLGRKVGYTSISSLALQTNPAPGEAVPKTDQERYSDDAHASDALREAQMPLHEELARIEPYLRPQQRAELRRRIEGLKRSTHEKAA